MNLESLNKFVIDAVNDPVVEFVPLSGGANNQGYKVLTSTNKIYFLKCFPAQSETSSKKLENEFLFTQALEMAGIAQIPKAIACSKQEVCAVYEFIDGAPVKSVEDNHVLQAIEFIRCCKSKKINRENIQFASESPATFADFANIISHRLQRFQQAKIESPFNQQLFEFLDVIEEDIRSVEKHNMLDWSQLLERDLLSPSDFGFHNAIETTQGLIFIDFEYAGLDSSWKLFCDFYGQPAKKVPLSSARLFFQCPLFAALLLQPKALLAMYHLTLLKWCLIMLNEFLPNVQQRRAFSWGIDNDKDRMPKLWRAQKEQLQKCQLYYQEIPQKLEQLQDILQEQY